MAARLGRRPRARTRLSGEDLLPSEEGHAARGRAPPRLAPDAILPFTPRVLRALEASRATGREHGFLAYAPRDASAPLLAEEDTVGGPHEISWHWSRPHATVAFSFHTHPGARGLCVPSGMDAVGALIRGDHLVYVLTMDGRLSGWRWREPREAPLAVDEAMHVLSRARAFKRPFVQFLYDAFDAMRHDLLEPVYAARLEEDGRLARAAPDRGFFGPEERPPGWG